MLAVSLMRLCTKDFVRLIQEFPESTPCLKDLNRALEISKMNEKFVAEVIN
jgi:hypothetical protein